MSRILDQHAVVVESEPVTLGDLVSRLRMHDQAGFIEEAVERALVIRAARDLGIEADREAIQAAATAFRSKRKLLKAEDTNRWLEERGLDSESWLGLLTEDVLVAKFKEEQFGPNAAQYFAENRLSFEAATISRLSLSNEDLARELTIQLREEGASFADLSARYSEEEATKRQGGFVGRVVRKDLVATVSAAVFGAKAGDVLGPFKVGKVFQIIRVEEITPSKLTPDVRDAAIEALYREWLETARAKAAVNIPLFENQQEAVLA